MQERDLINAIIAKVDTRHPFVKKGIGDDCAVFTSPARTDLLVTADMLVENVHFDTRWHDPYMLGRKALAVNISDIAGMGGTPEYALLSLGVSPKYDSRWTNLFVDGFISLLKEFHCQLIGGDTVTAGELTVSVTVLGMVDEDQAICRSGARPGDSIYVSGELGSAAAGLYLCQSNQYTIKTVASSQWTELIERHLNPIPRVHLGKLLRQSGMVTAMQDISDGLATDLSHICTASEVHGLIIEECLPANQQLIAMCEKNQLSQVDFQIRGGEDYELLFTVQQGKESQFEDMIAQATDIPPVTRIGKIENGKGVSMLTRNGEKNSIEYQGYEHILKKDEESFIARQQK